MRLARKGGTMLSSSTARSLLIAAWLLIAGTAFGGELDALKNTTPGERAKAQTAMMKSKLGLTDDQMAKVSELNLKYAEKMDPIIKGSEGPLMKARDVRSVEQEKEDELKALLSPDQFQKFQAAKDEMRDQLIDQIQKQE
jgi:hypothetical protein